MSKFSDFVNNDTLNNDNKKNNGNKDINELINKYSTLSNDELMHEFLTETAKRKENGELTAEYISKVKNILKPHLTKEQIAKLDVLLEMVE